MTEAFDAHIHLDQTAEEDRRDLARRIGRHLKFGTSEADRRAAMEIARVLAADVSVAVRTALMEEVCASEFLPDALVATLMRDIHEVSLPFVRQSAALDEGQLIDLVQDDDPALHEAVAGRDHVSEPVSYAITEFCAEPAVETLMDNAGAEISSRVCHMVLDRFSEAESLLTTMSRRGDLPLEAVEPLLERLAGAAAEALVERYDVASDFASYLTESARRRVMGSTLENAPMDRIRQYMDRLKATDELTSDVLLHLVRNGNLNSFIVGVATYCGEDHWGLQKRLADDAGSRALARALHAAGMGGSNVGMMVNAYEETRALLSGGD